MKGTMPDRSKWGFNPPRAMFTIATYGVFRRETGPTTTLRAEGLTLMLDQFRKDYTNG